MCAKCANSCSHCYLWRALFCRGCAAATPSALVSHQWQGKECISFDHALLATHPIIQCDMITLSKPGMYCSRGTPRIAGCAATMPQVGKGVTATGRPRGGLNRASPPPRPAHSQIMFFIRCTQEFNWAKHTWKHASPPPRPAQIQILSLLMCVCVCLFACVVLNACTQAHAHKFNWAEHVHAHTV